MENPALKISENQNYAENRNLIQKTRQWIKTHEKKTVIISILALVLSFATIFYFLSSKTGNKSSINTSLTPSVTPLPTRLPLAQGPQIYTISSSENPLIYEAWFSTIDPKKGRQEAKIKIKDTLGEVTSVSVTVKTDKLSKTYTLNQTSGISSNGEWNGSWTLLNDTYNQNFIVTFKAMDNKNNNSSVDITIR